MNEIIIEVSYNNNDYLELIIILKNIELKIIGLFPLIEAPKQVPKHFMDFMEKYK